MDRDTPGIELALLEGMSETLLLRLRDKGITTRRELGEALDTPRARAELAQKLDVPRVHLDALHYLNFLLPEERAIRMLQQERTLQGALQQTRSAMAKVRWLIGGAAVLSLAALVTALTLMMSRPGGEPEAAAGGGRPAVAALADSVAQLQSQMESLKPLVAAQSRRDLAAAALSLTPAPAWNGPHPWSAGQHRTLAWSLGEAGTGLPLEGLSLALGVLDGLESPARWQDPVLQKAREASVLLEDFPPVVVETDWDLAAAAVRLRLASRAHGLGLMVDFDPPVLAAPLGFWEGYVFAPCEWLLAGVEGLPLSAESRPLWVDAVREVRHRANLGRDARADSPQAWAREYWVLRAETELAVCAVVAGWSDLRPYTALSPQELLARRSVYLGNALTVCPESVRAPLAWLGVELEEARRLISWLQGDDARREQARGLPWILALAELEDAYPLVDGGEDVIALSVQAALAAEGADPSRPFVHPRTRWECGLRPLLMEARRRALAQAGASPPGAP